MVILTCPQWNVWDETKAPGSADLEQTYDYTDMLGFCAWLNVLLRKHKDVAIACLAQTVNVVRTPARGSLGIDRVQIAPIMTRPDAMIFQTIYYP